MAYRFSDSGSFARRHRVPRALSFAALVVSTLALAACHGSERPETVATGPAVAVSVQAAHVEPLPVIHRASGTVRGRATIVVTSKTSGYVRAVHVSPGDRVKAGQVLVDLEANDIRAGVARSRAELAAAREARTAAASAVDAARIAAEHAKVSRDRMEKLLAGGAVTRQAYDDSDAAWRGAVAQQQMAAARLRTATSQIDAARAAVGEASATLGYAHVVAPFAGRVLERRVDPGALASPGLPLLVLDDEAGLRVEASVEESRASEIHLGDPVTVEVGSPVIEVPGTVGEIVPNVDPRSRAFLIKVDLARDVPDLHPGTFARVGFHAGTRPRLVVPERAITTSGALDRVFVVEHGVARLRMITLGETQEGWTEVRSGLAAAEQVVVDPPHALRDGSRVEVRS